MSTVSTETIDTDHLVVGAGAAGLAFADALLDHSDATVTIVDRRDGVGGHWRAAYPFVRLHQASSFYGVASTVLGGAIQFDGPEAGLHERASQPEILAYYDAVAARMVATGRMRLLTGHDVDGLDNRRVVSRADGTSYDVGAGTRVVDARFLAPVVPAEVPPPFEVDGARVVAVNDLPLVEDAPSRHVVVGSGKTATDAIVWLLTERSVDPGAITWVRPRDPWMLDRAVVQPDPAVFLGMAASVMEAAAAADTLDGLFLGLEAAGVMMRVDRDVVPTMAKAPTLGAWELELLRTVGDVVRLGHVRSVRPGRLELDGGAVTVPADALVVHCAADGLRHRSTVPIWAHDAITLQPVRAGFPCFGAALVGYVEAIRGDATDATKNALCPPSAFGDSLRDWAEMTLVGARNAAAFGAEPDIAAWASGVALNPAAVPADHPGSPALDAARERLARWSAPGLERLARLTS